MITLKRIFYIVIALIALAFVLSNISKIFLGFLYIAVLVALFVVLAYLVKIFFYSVLAPRDIIVGLIEDGTMVVITSGDAVKDIKIREAGKALEKKEGPNKYEVVDISEVKVDSRTNFEKWFEKNFPGLIWIGVPGVNKIYKYGFYWKTVDNEGNIINKQDKRTRSIYSQAYNYVMELKNAETASMVDVDLYFSGIIRVTNPYKALFKNKKWLVIVTATLVSAFINYIKSFDDPEDLIKDKSGSPVDIADGFYDYLSKANSNEKYRDEKGKLIKCKNIMEELQKVRGISLDEIRLGQIDYKDWAVIAKKIKTEEINAKALVVASQGKAKSKKIIAQGEGEAVEIYKALETKAYSAQMKELGKRETLVIDWNRSIAEATKYGGTVIESGAFAHALDRFGSMSDGSKIDMNEAIRLLTESGIGPEGIKKIIDILVKQKGGK